MKKKDLGRIIKLEQKFKAARSALKLARESLSRNSVITVVTILVSVVALIISFVKGH